MISREDALRAGNRSSKPVENRFSGERREPSISRLQRASGGCHYFLCRGGSALCIALQLRSCTLNARPAGINLLATFIPSCSLSQSHNLRFKLQYTENRSDSRRPLAPQDLWESGNVKACVGSIRFSKRLQPPSSPEQQEQPRS